MNRKVFWYSALIVIGVALDRITKVWSLAHCAAHPVVINQYVSFFVAYNRGMAWSLASSENSYIFTVVTIFVLCVTILLALFAYHNYQGNKNIVGECMVIAGSVGNLYDRITVGGVIDFIECSYADWYWPVFNVADISIVIGVMLMISLFKKERV